MASDEEVSDGEFYVVEKVLSKRVRVHWQENARWAPTPLVCRSRSRPLAGFLIGSGTAPSAARQGRIPAQVGKLSRKRLDLVSRRDGHSRYGGRGSREQRRVLALPRPPRTPLEDCNCDELIEEFEAEQRSKAKASAAAASPAPKRARTEEAPTSASRRGTTPTSATASPARTAPAATQAASPAKGATPGQQADGGQGGDSDVEQMPAPPKRTETLTQATPYPEGNWEELVERIITVSKDDKHDGRLVATVRWYAIPPPRSPARVGVAANG